MQNYHFSLVADRVINKFVVVSLSLIEIQEMLSHKILNIEMCSYLRKTNTSLLSFPSEQFPHHGISS